MADLLVQAFNCSCWFGMVSGETPGLYDCTYYENQIDENTRYWEQEEFEWAPDPTDLDKYKTATADEIITLPAVVSPAKYVNFVLRAKDNRDSHNIGLLLNGGVGPHNYIYFRKWPKISLFALRIATLDAAKINRVQVTTGPVQQYYLES